MAAASRSGDADGCGFLRELVDAASGQNSQVAEAGGTSFYIDRTEVTNEQYAAFLMAKAGDTSGQRPECQWNDDFKPAAAIGDDPRPAVNVDFCDAVAFCDWAGERLCGSLAGGQVAPSNLRDPTISQWYLA